MARRSRRRRGTRACESGPNDVMRWCGAFDPIVPDEGISECTADIHCWEGGVCQDGVCLHACASEADCPTGHLPQLRRVPAGLPGLGEERKDLHRPMAVVPEDAMGLGLGSALLPSDDGHTLRCELLYSEVSGAGTGASIDADERMYDLMLL